MKDITILTIAGSDSGGGAGIQADLNTFAMHGLHGASVITALTAQNTLQVAGISAPEPDFVDLQLRTVLEDFNIAAAKTGMLHSGKTIAIIAETLKEKAGFPLVVDPVCVSGTGAALIEPEAIKILRDRLLPRATIVTPNIPEAEVLSGVKINKSEDVAEALERILDYGSEWVMIKGGHLPALSSEVKDWLGSSGGERFVFTRPRLHTRSTHGTGCTLSAAMTCHLGLGSSVPEAVRRAGDYLALAMQAAEDLGQGIGPVNHRIPLIQEKSRLKILGQLAKTGRTLALLPGMARLIPEISLNMAYAIPFAENTWDVAAFPGRITADIEGNVIIHASPTFGASSHIARVLLAAAQANPKIRAAANIRNNQAIMAALERAGLPFVHFDRAKEPQEIKKREGGTLDWGTRLALGGCSPEQLAQMPAVVDKGEVGKEPIIRLLGRNPAEILDKIRRILGCL